MVDALVSVALDWLIASTDEDGSLVAGVEKEYEKLINTLAEIQGVLQTSDERQVIESVWSGRLRTIIHDFDDVVDEWSAAAIRKSKSVGVGTSPSPLNQRKVSNSRRLKSPSLTLGPFAINIRHIQRQLAQFTNSIEFSSISRKEGKNERLPTTSVMGVSEVRGREMEQDRILKKLLCESNFPVNSDLYIISIVGMVGIGKTTLAQLIYNHPEVKAHFDERIWVCASENLSDPIRDFRATVDPIKLISGRKFLLVLDDVRTYDEEKLEQLKVSHLYAGKGSRILVTTQKQSVAMKMGAAWILTLGELSEGHCWELFSQTAFSGKSRPEKAQDQLKEISMKIAGKCKGLPLAAKILGNVMMSFNIREWESVLGSDEVWQELIEQHLFPSIWWIYSSLPPPLKLCLSYCAIFPKGYTFERSTLTKLWMSQWHVISPWETITMEKETRARNYFEDLAMHSFFQDFESDPDDGCIISCKMHDLMHDFVRFVAKNECRAMEVNNNEKEVIIAPSFGKVFHASFTCLPTIDLIDPFWISNANYLRTLLLISKDNIGIATALPTILARLPNVRALELSNNRFIEQIPEELGKLLHLRYLDLSNNGRLRVLPESLCSLFHLQTLRLSRCRLLRELPRGMGKLVNLRHLEVGGTNLRSFPKGMRNLTSLRTLTEFIVSWDDVDGCKLQDLKNLNSLEGSLSITGLGDVRDAREADEAELMNKEHLRHLELSFWGEKQDLKEMKSVAEALEPHQNLKSLGFHDYIDAEFPNYIASLTNLKRLQLSRCIDCLHLPPLGRLPVLESLEISRMDSLKSIGLEFLATDQHHHQEAFPKLKQLIFSELGKWEKWEVQDQEQRDDMPSMMPRLGLLIINGCPKLEELPNQLFQEAPLQELRIYASPILRRGYQRGGNHWNAISHIPITEVCENDKQMLVDYTSYYFQYRYIHTSCSFIIIIIVLIYWEFQWKMVSNCKTCRDYCEKS